MSIVLNEKEFAIEALQKCTLGVKPIETISRVAKYFRSEGYSKADIHDMLEEFIMKCDPAINVVKWQNTIDSQAKCVDKCHLIEIDSIPITQKELDVCNSLPWKQMQRLMFTLICVAKFFNATNVNNNSWINMPDKEIFKMANVVTAIKRQSLMLNDLRGLGLIRFSRKVDSVSINVQCVDEAGSPVLTITDYRNLGYQYMRYCGEPFIECESCGIVVKKTSNVQKYCAECAVEINRQKCRENWRNVAMVQ